MLIHKVASWSPVFTLHSEHFQAHYLMMKLPMLSRNKHPVEAKMSSSRIMGLTEKLPEEQVKIAASGDPEFSQNQN